MNYNIMIRKLRIEFHYTQQQVADYLHISQRTYCDYERGINPLIAKTRIPVDNLIKLARLYNVDMNYICGLSEVNHFFPTEREKIS